MWLQCFEERLRAWHDFRQTLSQGVSDTELLAVNRWWWRAPMVNYCLHWNDSDNWPTPWELLALDGYCNISRALGMIYTLALASPDLRTKLSMVHGHEATLVMVQGRSNVLNWDPGSVDAIDLADLGLIGRLDCSKILDWKYI